MTPAAVLPVEPGDRVLDLCAAPGGKSTELAAKLPESKRKAALAVLAEDPRPAYHDDERRYGVSFAGYDIRFHVKDRVLTVCEVVPLKIGRQPL